MISRHLRYTQDDNGIILPPVRWSVGEHVAIVGGTGSGKTFLVSQLVKLRRYVIVLRTKPDDIKFPGFTVAKSAKALDDIHNEKILIDLTGRRTMQGKQAWEAKDVLDKVWEMGRWTVVVDEAYYVERKLGLGHYLEMLLTQGRSLGISVVLGMQRPVWVTRFGLSEPTHVFSFRVEGRDLKSIAESTTPRITQPITNLPRYHFSHFYRVTGELREGEAHGIAKVLRLA